MMSCHVLTSYCFVCVTMTWHDRWWFTRAVRRNRISSTYAYMRLCTCVVCMYVCMYVYMYVCMYVYGSADGDMIIIMTVYYEELYNQNCKLHTNWTKWITSMHPHPLLYTLQGMTPRMSKLATPNTVLATPGAYVTLHYHHYPSSIWNLHNMIDIMT